MGPRTLVLAAGRPPAPLAGLEPVRTADGFVPPEGRFDVALAADWEATAHLFSVDARRHVLWVDVLGHHTLASWQAERIAAAVAYDLPTDFVAAGSWIAEELRALRPDARVLEVVPGLPAGAPGDDAPGDDAAGRGAAPPADRVLREGAAAPAGRALRGGAAAPAGRALRGGSAAPADRRSGVGPAGGRAPAPGGPLRVRVDGDAEAAAAVLAEVAEPVSVVDGDADVLLRWSALHGLLDGAARGQAARGVVPLLLPGGGAQDIAEHLVSGVLLEPDDPRGAARWLDHLARDRELLARLRAGALAHGERWPSEEEAAAALTAALEQLVAEEPPPAAAWPRRLMADAMAGVALYRADHFVVAGELERLQADETYLTARAMRRRLDDPRLDPVRKVAQPLVRAAKKRLRP